MDDPISKLSELLSSPGGADKIRGLLGAFTSSDGGDDASGIITGETNSSVQSSSLPSFGINEAEIMGKMAQMMSVMNDRNDSRIVLLSALRPFLGASRAAHLDSAMKIMQISKVSRLLSGRRGR